MSEEPRSDTQTLINAMRILAKDIQSGDGVANAAIAEAADRLEEQQTQLAGKDAKIERLRGDEGLAQESKKEIQTRGVRKNAGLSMALLDFVRLTGSSVWAGPFKTTSTIQSTLARYNASKGTNLKLNQEEFHIVAKDGTELCKIWRVSPVKEN